MLGPESILTLDSIMDSAFMYQREGNYRLGGDLCRAGSGGAAAALGSENPDTMASAADLALAYLSQGKFAESEPLAREALEFDRKNQPDDWQRFRAESLLGASLAGQKKYAEAEPLLLEGYQGMLARKEQIGPRTDIIWTAPANGPFSFIRPGENREKLLKSRKKQVVWWIDKDSIARSRPPIRTMTSSGERLARLRRYSALAIFSETISTSRNFHTESSLT